MTGIIDHTDPHDDPDFYDLAYVAERLGISRRTVADQVKAGTFPLPVLVIGRRKVIGRVAFERAIAGETFTQERAS